VEGLDTFGLVVTAGLFALLLAYAVWSTLVARRAAAMAYARAEMLDQIHDAVIVWRPGAGILYWNRGAEQLYGWTAADAIGRAVHELLATRFPAGMTPAAFDAHLVHRGSWAGTMDQTARDGRFLHVDTRMELISDEHGQPTVVETNYDVTAREEAERARAASEARGRAVLETAVDAILTIDGRGLVLSFNPAAERIFGYRADEVIGRNVTMLMPEPYRSEHDGYLERYHRTGERRIIGIGREVTALRKDGSTFPADLSVGEADVGGKLYTGILRDISDRKEADADREQILVAERIARAEADREARLKDELLAAVSHELRTPLTAILGWAGLLREGRLEPEAAVEALRSIERNAAAQAQLVDDLLDTGRIVAGKMHVDLRPTNLAQSVRDAIESVAPAARVRHIRIEQDLKPDRAIVHGDPGRLQQIAWNLLSNAVKFTPEGGLVRVAVRRIGPQVDFVVRDTGEGIAPEQLPHLFERFWQADQAITRVRQRGLGVGLSLVRHLVELHGGEVRGESEGLGRGARFVVSLPAAADDVVADEPTIQPLSSLAGLRVLVVDDDAEVCRLVRRILELHGAEVYTAGSTAEALESIQAARPDVLVADLGMPWQDGYQLVRTVRALEQERGGKTPAAALSALARPEDRVRALSAGFQVHLAKPIDAGTLVRTVAGLAGRAQA
jgi:PAS domain S-box-containing protein